MATDIKKILKSENLIIGTDRVMKGLRNNEMERVLFATNAPADLVSDLRRYADLTKTEIEMIGLPNDELGVACKKPFSISVIGLKKAAPVAPGHHKKK